MIQLAGGPPTFRRPLTHFEGRYIVSRLAVDTRDSFFLREVPSEKRAEMTNSRWNSWLRCAIFAMLPIISGATAFAQQITGSVTGSVVDPSGAVIVAAKVTLTNTGTSETQTTASDTAGNFRFLLLPPGTYTIEGSVAGFKTFRREGIIVEADRSLAVPITLTVGQATETVEVVGGTPLLEPNSSEAGHHDR